MFRNTGEPDHCPGGLSASGVSRITLFGRIDDVRRHPAVFKLGPVQDVDPARRGAQGMQHHPGIDPHLDQEFHGSALSELHVTHRQESRQQNAQSATLAQQQERLRGELEQANAALAGQREQIATLEAERRTLREDREQLRSKIKKINSALGETRQQMALFESHQQTLSEETGRLRNELAARDQQLAEMKTELDAVSVALQQAQSARPAAAGAARTAGSELAGLETPAGAAPLQPATSTLPPGLSRGDDSDGDGISDTLDLSLETPAGVKVDEMGCAPDTSISLPGVNFRYDSWELTRAARAILDRVAGILVQYPPLQLEVAGHTDAQGDRDYNRWLSEQRAKAVREYLTTRGVSPANITARGYGSEQPIADNSTREGLLKNRRVELRRLR